MAICSDDDLRTIDSNNSLLLLTYLILLLLLLLLLFSFLQIIHDVSKSPSYLRDIDMYI